MKRSFLVLSVAFLMATNVALAGTPGTDLFLPSVGHGQGSCPGGICAQWRTDAWVFNPDTAKPAAVTIYFLQRGATQPDPRTGRSDHHRAR